MATALSGGFFQQRSLEGWDIAYDSRRQHNVGVINPDLLPTDNLIYRYYFFANPIPIEQALPPSFGGIGGGAADITALFFGTGLGLARDKVEFILDFVTSSPRFDIVMEVASGDILSTSGTSGVLQMPDYYLSMAYMFQVDVDADGVVTHIYKRDGTRQEIGSGTNQIQLPTRPNPDDRGRDWFEYYDTFKEPPWSEYNMFNRKEHGPDFDFTYGNMVRSRSTDHDRANVERLAAGNKYLITYEPITSHLYRQHVKIGLLQTNFYMLGVNISANNVPPFVESMEIAHYMWKNWTSTTTSAGASGGTVSTTTNHEGWRISETWMHPLKVHQIQDPNQPYDPITNPRVRYETGRSGGWAFFNMTNENLSTYKDEDRVGYAKEYAEYMSENRTDAPLSSPANTNEITPSTARNNNFQIEYVSNKRTVNYGTYLDAANIVWEIGGAMGVLFRANQTEFAGHWFSEWYGRGYPANTRIVNLFNDSQHGNNGNVIAVWTKKRPMSLSMIEDPYFFFITNGKLYMRLLDDVLQKKLLGSRLDGSQFDLEHQSSQTTILGESGQSHPGRSIILGEKDFKTFINNMLETAPVVTDSDGNTVMSFPTIAAQITSATLTASSVSSRISPVDSTKTIYTFNAEPSGGQTLSSIALKMRISGNSSATLKIRGWSASRNQSDDGNRIDWKDAKSDREIAGVTVSDNAEATIDLSGWSSIGYLEFISDREISSVESLKAFYTDAQTNSELLMNNISSIAGTTDKKGTFMLFYVNKDKRLNFMSTSNGGHTWQHIEYVVMRGDVIDNISGIINRVDNSYMLFYYYKDALLCQKFDLDLFEIVTRDPDTKAKALDSIRMRSAHLVWGDVIKPSSERVTRTDSAGNVVFEDINDNLIIDQTDEDDHFSRFDSIERIMDGTSSATYIDLNVNNKFIRVGAETVQSGLASSSPTSTDYAVYENRRGIFRVMLRHEVFGDNPTYRCLESTDRGATWSDAWNYKKTVDTDKIARINYLSLGEDSEEGANLYLLYSSGTEKLYMFYFYKDVLLCKIADENMFSRSENEIAEELGESPLYAVAGLLTNVEDESKHIGDGNIIFGNFQQNQVNVTKYFSGDYEPQQPCGHVTSKGYVIIYLINNSGTIDAYFFDGDQWRPEHAVINNAFNDIS